MMEERGWASLAGTMLQGVREGGQAFVIQSPRCIIRFRSRSRGDTISQHPSREDLDTKLKDLNLTL